MGVIRAVFGKIVSIFKPSRYGKEIVQGLNAIAGYVDHLIPVLEIIRDVTVKGDMDSVLEAARLLGLPESVVRGQTVEEAKFNLALAWALHRWPGARLRHVRRAIEVAYGALKP